MLAEHHEALEPKNLVHQDSKWLTGNKLCYRDKLGPIEFQNYSQKFSLGENTSKGLIGTQKSEQRLSGTNWNSKRLKNIG